MAASLTSRYNTMLLWMMNLDTPMGGGDGGAGGGATWLTTNYWWDNL